MGTSDAIESSERGHTSVTLTVPWPPSINHYWTYIPPKAPRRIPFVVVGNKGKKYRNEIKALCTGLSPVHGPLMVQLLVYPPDRRKRDLDNLQKALLDALQHSGLYADDSLIDDLRIKRMSVDQQKLGFIDVLVQRTELLPF